MNFTREPIIESVITPKEGCKLAVRNSKKGGGTEDYIVEAVEIVNFGNAIFYRSTESPKSFLVSVTDYEILELKDTKMVLKSVSIEKAIKIGGGKEEEKQSSRKRKAMKKQQEQMEARLEIMEEKKEEEAQPEAQVSSSILRKLFPPPPNLIKEKLNHVKAERGEVGISQELVKEEILKDKLEKTREQKDENPSE